MKRKYRNNSIDTSPSTSSESSISIVSLVLECMFNGSLLLFYLTFSFFLSHSLYLHDLSNCLYHFNHSKKKSLKAVLTRVDFPLQCCFELITIVKSLQLLLFKWEKDIQMADWKRCRLACRILCLSWQTSNERRTKTEIASGEFQWECVLSGKRMMDREEKKHRCIYIS